MVMALIDAAHDKEDGVREAVLSSLATVGRHQPDLVLSSAHVYLNNHSKLATSHRVSVLTVMEGVISGMSCPLEEELATAVVLQAADEMTRSKDVVPAWQTAASGVLVAMGTRHINTVMEEMMVRFQPGILPHFFVVETIAKLAVSNVYGMVPFIKALLGTMLPMLGLAKHDNMKWIFSFALARFSESIAEYVANLEKAPDPSVRKSFYAAEVYVAQDLLLNTWLTARDAKLRLQVVEALGYMSHIVSRDKLSEQLPRLLPAVISLYRRAGDAYLITQGLCMILDAATEGGSLILEQLLDNLLNALFPQVCQPVDYSSPVTVKNHNELLRCFAALARSFSSRLVAFLLTKLEPTNERSRVAALSVFRHLINSSDLADKQGLVLTGLRVVLSDPSNKVKKMFAQTVIAMAHHGYLELEGGQDMIEFIVRQCALTSDPAAKRSADADFVSNEALRSMCDNVLTLLSTTVDNMDPVLYPYLLECVVPEQLTAAQATVCRCVATVASRVQETSSQDFMIDFTKEVNVPRPAELFARLLVLSGLPHHGNQRGGHTLAALLSLAPLIDSSLPGLWGSVIPRLSQHLDDHDLDSGKFSQKTWDDLLLKLLSKSLDEVDNEEWVCCLGDALANQLPLYNAMPEEKNFACKCLGVVLRKSGKKDFVSTRLQTLFSSVRHSVLLEREGFAVAMGYTAASHLDTVLLKLDNWTRNKRDGNKQRSSGLFNFIKDAIGPSGEEEDKVRASLVLSYGYAALYCPVELVESRMEAQILKALQTLGANVKDSDVRRSVLCCVELVARTMHPDHLHYNHVFSERSKLLTLMTGYISSDKSCVVTTDTRALAMKACAALVQLPPSLTPTELMDLVSACLERVMSVTSSRDEAYEAAVEQEALVTRTLLALEELLTSLLTADLTPATLDVLLVLVGGVWGASVEDEERHRAMTLVHRLLSVFHDRVDVVQCGGSGFSSLGSSLGRLVPRCADPVTLVRQSAVSCVLLLLRTALKFSGGGGGERDPVLDALPALHDRVHSGEPSVLLSVINDIAKVLNKKLPAEQLMAFVEALFEGLLDSQSHCASAACCVLNATVKSRGSELHSQVGYILSSLLVKLEQMSHEQSRVGALRVVRTLAAHHMLTVMEVLLERALPLDQHTLDCWSAIGQDSGLVSGVVDQLLDQLRRWRPYEEKPDPSLRDSTMRVASPLPLTASLAVSQLCQCSESRSAIIDNLPRLMAAMLVQAAAAVGTKPPSPKENKSNKDTKSGRESRPPRSAPVDPTDISVTALRTVCEVTENTELTRALNDADVWSLVSREDTAPEGYTELARCIVERVPQLISRLVPLLTPVLSSVYTPCRVMTAAFLSQLVCHRCGGDLAQLEVVVHSLLGQLVDYHHKVRMYCIRGLGNVGTAGHDLVQKYSTTVLSAMMTGMDDKEDVEYDITLEAMSGLSRVLAHVTEAQIRAILINISLRIRPCFEKDRACVRAAAVTLFGDLARFGDGPSREPFLEQIHTNFTSLLLHLNDCDLAVTQACKRALQSVGPMMGSDNLNTMFQKHLIEGGTLHYGEFINNLAKVIAEECGDKVNFYSMACVTFFKSDWPEIRANAAMLLGCLVGCVAGGSSVISTEHVCSSLVLLLRDQSATVRTRAAEAISLLHRV